MLYCSQGYIEANSDFQNSEGHLPRSSLGTRRDFLKGSAWMLGLAAMSGCMVDKISVGTPAANFRVPAMSKIRVGFIGIGNRGMAAVRRVSLIPGIETAALCDLRVEAVDSARNWLKKERKPGAMHEYKGAQDSWKGLCDDPDVDVVYIATPAILHVEMELYAMRAGKHVLCEVPGAYTLDECWEIVETSEKTHRHCMMLENCCYGEMEMFAWNLAKSGLLGELTHAEGGYIHNLTARHLENHFRNLKFKNSGAITMNGNIYPTHPLGPICLYLDINRGDKMDFLISLSSREAAWSGYIKETFGPDDWQTGLKINKADMNTTLIKTARGRTIMLQLDMATPRPYSRINLIQGSKGCFADYPPRLALSKVSGGYAKWMSEKEFEKTRREYMHPLWKQLGEASKRLGGHDGMDFIMDLRWAYCLQNGLPLDMDVYDLASWSAIVPCSAKSALKMGERVEIPDFTRGAWKSAKPLSIGAIDLKKMNLKLENVKRDDSQLSV